VSDDDRLLPITVRHDDLVEFAKVAAAVVDNPQRPDWLRADAQEFYDQCSHAILYCNDPSKRYGFHPVAFRVKGFYRALVDETLERLGEQVLADEPIRVLMARQAADLCDSSCYSIDFRLVALNALEVVLKSLEPQGLSVVE
jgi:hypothetical protein